MSVCYKNQVEIFTKGVQEKWSTLSGSTSSSRSMLSACLVLYKKKNLFILNAKKLNHVILLHKINCHHMYM